MQQCFSDLALMVQQHLEIICRCYSCYDLARHPATALYSVLLYRVTELRQSLSELYLSFNKLTTLDPAVGSLDRLLMLDLR